MNSNESDMQKKSFSTFHGLVKELSEYEKSNLLNKLLKIGQDTTDDQADQKSKNSTIADEHAKVIKYAAKELSSYGVIRKFFVWIEAFFNGLSSEDVIINHELNMYKKEIEYKYAKYINISENKLRPMILEKFIPVMAEINSIKTVCEDFFSDKVNYYEFLVYITENENASELSEILAMLSPETLDNKPELLEKNNYSTEKEKRIKQLFSKLSSSKYYEINKEMTKFDLVLKFIEYDFSYLTGVFNYSIIGQPFSNCEEIYVSHDITDYFERLYRMLISIDPDIIELKIINYFFEYLKIIFQKDPDIEQKIQAVKDSLVKILNYINELRSFIPYESMVKYFTGNILKVIKPLPVKINIIEMYKAYKRTFIDKLWDTMYGVIKARNVSYLVSDFFGEYKFDSLMYFDRSLIERLEKYSGMKVRDFYVLNVLDKFIASIYLEKILPVVNKIIIDGVFVKDILKANFTAAYYSLKSANDKIKLFDIQFKEDTVLRKKINNTLVKIAGEPNFKSILYNIIVDINEESYKVKFEIYESLKIMINFFRSLKGDDVTFNKIIANLNDLKVPVYPNIVVAIDKIDEYLLKFSHIYSLVEESF